MATRRLMLPPPYRSALSQVGVACAVGLLLGVVSLRLSPVWMLALLVGAILVLIVGKRPELGLLAVLVTTSSIVFEDSLPLIPIGIGSLHVADALLLGLLSLILLRALVQPGFKIVRTPLDIPLLSFYGAALFTTFLGISQSSATFEQGFRELRTLTYLLSFFVVTNLVREPRQLTLLLRGVALLAIVVALAMIVQFLMGDRVQLLPNRVEILTTEGKSFGGVTRVIPPGQSLVLIAFIVSSAALVLNRFRPTELFRLLQTAVLGLAVILTFNRSFWAGLFLAMLLLAAIVKGQSRQRLAAWLGAAALLLATTLLFAPGDLEFGSARLIAATLDRVATLGRTETLAEDSLQMRYLENEYAFPEFVAHPLVGLGFGARYRPFDSSLDWKGLDRRWYLHNGHLWILVKSGLVGYLCLIWLSVAFLVRGLKGWPHIRSSHLQAAVLGFPLAYVVVLVGLVVNPMLMQPYWPPIIGIMMGANEVILRDG